MQGLFSPERAEAWWPVAAHAEARVSQLSQRPASAVVSASMYMSLIPYWPCFGVQSRALPLCRNGAEGPAQSKCMRCGSGGVSYHAGIRLPFDCGSQLLVRSKPLHTSSLPRHSVLKALGRFFRLASCHAVKVPRHSKTRTGARQPKKRNTGTDAYWHLVRSAEYELSLYRGTTKHGL